MYVGSEYLIGVISMFRLIKLLADLITGVYQSYPVITYATPDFIPYSIA